MKARRPRALAQVGTLALQARAGTRFFPYVLAGVGYAGNASRGSPANPVSFSPT